MFLVLAFFLFSLVNGVVLNNTRDVSYSANIQLANQTFQVLIDTGSSDLWVAGNVPGSIDTGKTGTVTYAGNKVTGAIKLAPLTFAGYQVADQAFLQITPDKNQPEGSGILGLGPSSSSLLTQQLGARASPVLERIFEQNRSTPNFFTILLGRDKDPTDFYPGSITVGHVLDDYSSVLSQPKLFITQVHETIAEDQHMQILLDPDGIIGPDSLPIPFQTAVNTTADKKQATVVLDCGFTLPQMDRSIVDAIYSRFEGAEYQYVQGIGNTWTLPCELQVNLTFKFSGVEYPVHPLDMSMKPSNIGLDSLKNSAGKDVCVGTFQPFVYDRGAYPNYDIVLGMAFMRNVYTLFDHGDYIPDSDGLRDPYIQMLSTTTREEAHTDFVTSRLGGIDTTSSQILKPSSSNSKSTSTRKKTMYYVAAAIAVVGVLSLLTILWLCRGKRLR